LIIKTDFIAIVKLFSQGKQRGFIRHSRQPGHRRLRRSRGNGRPAEALPAPLEVMLNQAD
jgi:hypothetical protein